MLLSEGAGALAGCLGVEAIAFALSGNVITLIWFRGHSHKCQIEFCAATKLKVLEMQQQLAMHLHLNVRPAIFLPSPPPCFATKTKRRKAISEINCLSFAFEIFIYKREINSTLCHGHRNRQTSISCCQRQFADLSIEWLSGRQPAQQLDLLINSRHAYQYLWL